MDMKNKDKNKNAQMFARIRPKFESSFAIFVLVFTALIELIRPLILVRGSFRRSIDCLQQPCL